MGDEQIVERRPGVARAVHELGIVATIGVTAANDDAPTLLLVEHVAERDVPAVRHSTAHLVVAASHRGRKESLWPIEGPARGDVDGPADRVGVHVRHHRLGHLEARDEIGGDRVHRHPAGAELGGRSDELPVDGDVVQAGIDAAHDDEPSFALIDLHRHAGNPPQRFGRVVVRETAHGIGGDNVEDVLGAAFLLPGQRHPGHHRDVLGQAGERRAGNRRSAPLPERQ